MSQYHFQDQDKTVLCGFDRPLRTHHLTITQQDVVIYTSLMEPRGALSREALHSRLSEHGVRRPPELDNDLDLDEAGLNPVNHVRTFELPPAATP